MKAFFQRPADQNSYTFINTDQLGHSITKGKRETDIRDLDAPEIMDIKQVQPSDLGHYYNCAHQTLSWSDIILEHALTQPCNISFD